MLKVKDIRAQLIKQYTNEKFVTDKTGVKTVEIIGAHFVANEPAIFHKPNEEYIERELTWYKSMSLHVEDIPGKCPEIWKQVASKDGTINSNYGWCVWSKENGNQYNSCLSELKKNPDSRRAIMIYNRPSMHIDYCKNGMSDFMCCQNTMHFIRNNELISIVTYRSQDAIFGYANDYAWADYIHNNLANDLSVKTGNIIWNAGSLHVYERHFKYIQEALPHYE